MIPSTVPKIFQHLDLDLKSKYRKGEHQLTQRVGNLHVLWNVEQARERVFPLINKDMKNFK